MPGTKLNHSSLLSLGIVLPLVGLAFWTGQMHMKIEEVAVFL